MQTIPAGVWKERNYILRLICISLCMGLAPIRWTTQHRMKINKNYFPSIIVLENKILNTRLPARSFLRSKGRWDAKQTTRSLCAEVLNRWISNSPWRCVSVPLQAWSGPEGSRKLRFPDFMKTAQIGGKVGSLTHRPHLPQGNPPGTHFC